MNRNLKIFGIVICLLIFILASNIAEAQQPLAQQAFTLFEQHCLDCHGEFGSYSDVLTIKHKDLIEGRSVIPGQPDASELYLRLLGDTDTGSQMPLGQDPLDSEAIATIRRWIEADAPDWEAIPKPKRRFITTEEVVKTIHTHVESLTTFDRSFARYFTLTYLYNAGASDDNLRAYRNALSKLVNSLSWGAEVIKPTPIDHEQTIFYIDLRHYEWDIKSDKWYKIEQAYPYGVQLKSSTWTTLCEETNCELPFVRADWFIATASLPPLYHEILGLPETDKELETQLEVNVAENIKNAPGVRVWRAGFDEKIRIIPIILEHCDWQNHQLSDFQVLPDKGLPITKWSDKSEGWQSVVDGVRRSIHKIQSQADLSSGTSETELRTEVAFQRGNVLMMLGQIEVAIKAYSQTIGLNPHHADAYNNRGVAYESNKDFNLAIQDFNMAKQLKPDYAIVYYNLGVVYVKKGMLDIAIQNYSTAIKLQPDYAEAYNNRANVYSRQRKFDKAMADYKTAIQLKPDLPKIYYSRAVTHVDKGEADEAINDYNMAIRLKPDYAEAYLNRGTVYRGKGSVDQAISDYSMAIRLKSDYTKAYYDRGNAYFNKGEYTSAIADYEKVVELKPNYTDAYLNLGVSYIKKEQIDLAIQNFDMAIRCKPDYPAGYVNRGHAYINKRKFDNAIRDYSRAIQLDPELALELRPNYAAAYFGRGTAYLRKGEPALAIKDYTTVIELEPGNAAAYGNRGNAYFLKGEFHGAIKDFDTLIQLNADDAAAYGSRGFAMLHLEKWGEAEVDLITARNKGLDVMIAFSNAYGSIANLERLIDAKLPPAILLVVGGG